MKKYYTLLILIFSTTFIYASHDYVSGYITDKESNTPIDAANIFINGSTTGTSSDKSGYYSLKINQFPAEIVVSHLGYSTISIMVYAPTDSLNLTLHPQSVLMEEFSFSDKSHRKKYLNLFNEWFLGADYWGANAKVLNDSVLVFVSTEKELKTYAISPLKISLPRLGYNVSVDIQDFSITYNSIKMGAGSFLTAFYFFKELNNLSKAKLKRVRKQRCKAYYGSSQHFLRSLYKQQLKENGYQIFYKHIATPRYNDKQLAIKRNKSGEGFTLNNISEASEEYVDPKTNIKIGYIKDKNGNNYGVLQGYKGDAIKIVYHYRRNKPVNPDFPNTAYVHKSTMYIKKEVCIFREDGTIADNSLIFDGYIGSLRVGAILPNNYTPELD